MITSTAHVPTEHASKYLVSLAKHWSHRFPDLTYTPDHAEIPLPLGPCRLDASSAALDISVTAENVADVERLASIVAEHLQRFAFREPMEINWAQAS